MRIFCPFLLLAPALFILLGGLSSCRKKAKVENPEVLAVVAEHRISEQDVLAERDRRRDQGRPVAGKDALVDEMIEYQRLLEYAKLQGVDQDPAYQRSVNNLLIGILKEKELTAALDSIEISDEELMAEYEARRESMAKPGALRFSIIKVAVKRHSSPERLAEARARMDAARDLAIASDAGFEEASAKHSDDQASRYRGGDIGWCEKGKARSGVAGEVLDAGHQLSKNGDVSEVIRSSAGFHLIKRTDTRESSVPAFHQVKNQLRSELIRAKREAIQKQFEEKVASAIKVQRFPERLETFDFGKTPMAPEERPPQNP